MLACKCFFIVLCALAGLSFFAGRAVAADAAISSEQTLGQGSVRIIDLGALRLHAWQTGDALNDQCFLLETPTNLVGIESPAFNADIPVWKNYIASLGKPLTDLFIASHPTGGRWYGSARSHATAGSRAAIMTGATKALSDSLGKAFADFNTDIADIDSILPAGSSIVGGIEADIMEAGDSYHIAIPSAGLIYTHMLGADCHSILTGEEQISQFLALLETMVARDYRLILSSHHAPETQKDVQTKIAYVKHVRELYRQCADKDEFISRVKNAYPDYTGVNYLEMTANCLFH